MWFVAQRPDCIIKNVIQTWLNPMALILYSYIMRSKALQADAGAMRLRRIG